jgi:hypothetical protein
MISKIWNALAIVRHAVAITIVMGAAGATVASSVDASAGHQVTQAATMPSVVVSVAATKNVTTNELEQLVKACLATKDPQSTDCATAVEASGLSSGAFWAKIAMSLNEQLVKAKSEQATKTEPKTEPKTEQPKPAETAKPNEESLSLLVKDCLVNYAALKTNTEGASLASDACRKAIEASGLTSTDFWARFGPKTTATAKPEPTKRPETSKRPETVKPTTTVSTAQLEVLVKDCFAKYLVAKNTKEGGSAALEACNRAMAASGLTGDAFWAKFGRPGSN